MAKPCSICTDPRRADIDKSLESLPRHEISRIYGIPKHRIDNHAQNHLRKRTIGGVDDGNSSVIATLKAEAQSILDNSKNEKLRLDAIQRLQQLHELELRLHQDQPGTGALANDPAFQKLAVALDSGLCSKCVAALDGILEGMLGTAIDQAKSTTTPGDMPP